MELVIGGAFQGKLTWALAHYGLTMDDVCDLAVSEPRAGAKCYCHLESLSRREADMERYLPLFENAVVVCREVSGGIVPMTVRSGRGGSATVRLCRSWPAGLTM